MPEHLRSSLKLILLLKEKDRVSAFESEEMPIIKIKAKCNLSFGFKAST